MNMAASFASYHFLLIFLMLTSARIWVNADCTLAVIGGGCPDLSQCVETCRPCYRGIGQVRAYCRPAGGGVPFDECMCTMTKGAPCHPPAPPQCPALPHGAVLVNVTYS